MTADSWFTPGRPTNPDFLVLADIILDGDAASEAGKFDEYIAEHSTVPLQQLSEIALHEANVLCDVQHAAPQVVLVETAWIMGFSAGLRVSRNTSPATDEQMNKDPEKALFPGVDPESVKYAARQRAMRMTPLSPKESLHTRVLLAGAWMDAVLAGLRFDERRESFRN